MNSLALPNRSYLIATTYWSFQTDRSILLPFPALMRNSTQFLVELKPLATMASATVYAALKKERHANNRPIQVAAFGDPRYPSARTADQHGLDSQVGSAMISGMSLEALPFSRMEVENISALYPEHSRKYLGDQATEEHSKSLGRDMNYIHFAVHALLEERFPLNSALILTLPEKVTSGRDNGLLQAWEIFEQVRLDADLVTLSACNTGRGMELSGEGLLGLTSAFQYAGARSIVASLWNVDDFQTMQLMTEFYRELRNKSSKDEALQAAQLRLIRSKGASAPYYWAGFAMFGDWK